MKRQADAVGRQVEATKEAADATSGQLDVMKQEGRAWVGPVGISWVNPSSGDEPLKGKLLYRNFGRQPATHFYSVSAARLPPINTTVLTDIVALPFWKDKAQFDPDAQCDATQYKLAELTVYPSDITFSMDVGIRNEFQLTVGAKAGSARIPVSAALNGIKSKHMLFVVFGCFTYTTFGEIAFTTWCAMLTPPAGDNDDIATWPFVFCPYGNGNKIKGK